LALVWASASKPAATEPKQGGNSPIAAPSFARPVTEHLHSLRTKRSARLQAEPALWHRERIPTEEFAMPSPIETVTAFLDQCASGKAEMLAAFHRYFTPQTVWENVGFSTSTGVAEAMAVIDAFDASIGASAFRAEMLAIASEGNRVLTERIDHLLDGEGKTVQSLQLMGIFEVSDCKIVAWRDYFDTASFANATSSAG
jgi:limonene-1,2-epoxide hydrolase